jgi:integral membrane sensor domain MASE1
MINQVVVVLLLFISMYLLLNSRKPIYVDIIDDNMEKYERATILSFSSQLKSLFTIVMAPLIGYVADSFGMVEAMMMIAVILIILAPFTIIKNSSYN